jgi:hypothetical protein
LVPALLEEPLGSVEHEGACLFGLLSPSPGMVGSTLVHVFIILGIVML